MSTNQAAVAAKKGYSTKELVLDAMFIALTYVFTAFVNVRLPIAANGGLIHLGNVPLFICAILLGKRTGMLAGAFGMGLFDLLSGWTAWAPFTFVIVGAIINISTLSFLGLGVQAPTPEWGAMLNEAKNVLTSNPTQMIVPGVAIVILVSAFNLMGDALRDVLDPKEVNV